MTSDQILPLIMRWAHIFAAIIALGGVIFLRFVLLPSAKETLDEETHAKLRTAITKRWMMFVHTCILLFLISGFYNYLAITRFIHDDQPLYHALFGVKFLLAIVVFALAIALTSLKPWSAKLRANARLWLSVLIALAVIIVLMSGVMRALPTVASTAGSAEDAIASE
ncbi:MAG: hypothetical protein SGI88_11930 [Candidatus Hydrogenedentes bacterium]|nr:hypothetical protein [Candidatus Hydrogenedentota bacterium]